MQTLNKGAPLDVAFINDLVNAVEKLIADSNTSQFKRATIKNTFFDAASALTLRTADTRIQAETVNVVSGLNLGERKTFSIPLSNFATVPVVTITPIITNEGATRPDVSVIITSITSTAVSGYYIANNKIESFQQIALSMIAIGAPSNSTGTTSGSNAGRVTNTQPPQGA